MGVNPRWVSGGFLLRIVMQILHTGHMLTGTLLLLSSAKVYNQAPGCHAEGPSRGSVPHMHPWPHSSSLCRLASAEPENQALRRVFTPAQPRVAHCPATISGPMGV